MNTLEIKVIPVSENYRNGLQRLIANGYRFTKSAKTVANIKEAVADNCHFTDFLADTDFIALSPDEQSSCIDIYDAYVIWCSRNAITPNKRDTLINWLKSNEGKYNIKYVYHVPIPGGGRVRGFKGIEVRCRSSIL